MCFRGRVMYVLLVRLVNSVAERSRMVVNRPDQRAHIHRREVMSWLLL